MIEVLLFLCDLFEKQGIIVLWIYWLFSAEFQSLCSWHPDAHQTLHGISSWNDPRGNYGVCYFLYITNNN